MPYNKELIEDLKKNTVIKTGCNYQYWCRRSGALVVLVHRRKL